MVSGRCQMVFGVVSARGPIEPKPIDKKPLNEFYAKTPSKSAIKEENNAGAKEAIADPKVKAATPKFNVLNVEKVLDQDINTETFFLYKVSGTTSCSGPFRVTTRPGKKSPWASNQQNVQQG